MKSFLFKSAFIFASFLAAPEVFASPDTSAMSATGAMVFVSSFSIIVRESLEAVFIIAAIIAALSSMGAKSSVRFVHFGWAGAIVAGFATWWVSVTIIRITDAQAEMIEGITSLLAAAVLFYVSYWLISKVEVGKWKRYIESKIKEATGAKNKAAIMMVAFFAVYREALETVLFYHALLFQAESSTSLILWGLAVGAAVVSVLAFAIFKFSIRLPVRYVFSVTGFALYAFSFTLAGKGVHELQEAGLVSETVADFVPRLSFLGIYPTYETFLPQIVIAAAIVLAIVKVSSISTRARDGA